MKRSSVDNPPRVGMVVRFARWYSGESRSEVFGERTVAGQWRPTHGAWNRGQYDIISEPVESEEVCVRCERPASRCSCHNDRLPCNCAQSLALTDALRRIVAAIGDDMLLHRRAPIDVLTEVNLIAREALK